MLAEKTYILERGYSLSSRIIDYALFIKLRLSSLVVFSAALGFIIASDTILWSKLLWLIAGGFLVTGSSNGFNQILERDLDKLMSRTANRPLPQGRMNMNEAMVLASIMGIAGIMILWSFMNPLSALLGTIALLLYTMAYTPLKRKTPFAVFIGAFPGAIPPLLGCVAATNGFGHISYLAWTLFTIQFIWQFPHFWAIAWVLDEDYKKAGFQMLPSGDRNKSTAFQILVYTLFLLPISLLPVIFHFSGSISAVVISACGILFVYQAYNLFISCTVKAASQLMFGSFIYLPVVQLAIMFGR